MCTNWTITYLDCGCKLKYTSECPDKDKPNHEKLDRSKETQDSCATCRAKLTNGCG
jgi:hypothetical protein